MKRSCSNCGTEFTEKINTDYSGGPIDPIPECWKDDKENGVCINCCNCYTHTPR